jgi:hypothetical protein
MVRSNANPLPVASAWPVLYCWFVGWRLLLCLVLQVVAGGGVWWERGVEFDPS